MIINRVEPEFRNSGIPDFWRSGIIPEFRSGFKSGICLSFYRGFLAAKGGRNFFVHIKLPKKNVCLFPHVIWNFVNP